MTLLTDLFRITSAANQRSEDFWRNIVYPKKKLQEAKEKATEFYQDYVRSPEGEMFPQAVYKKPEAEQQKTWREFFTSAAFGATSAPTPLKGLTPQLAQDILKVKPNATPEQINTSWRNLMKQKAPRTAEEIALRYNTNVSRLLNDAKNLLLSRTRIAPPVKFLSSGESLITKAENELRAESVKRGTVANLEKRIDSLLGTEGVLTGNWKKDYFYRKLFIEETKQIAPKPVVDEVEKIQDLLESIRGFKKEGLIKMGEGRTQTAGLMGESLAQTSFRQQAGLTPQDVYTGKKAVTSWESVVSKDINYNEKRLRAFEREQEALDTAVGGVKAFKGGKVPEVAAGFPSRELSGFNSKDRLAFSYQRETLARNIENTFTNPSDAKKIKEYLYEPIIKNETENIKFQNDLKVKLRKSFKDAGIKKGSKADFAAADYIEEKISELQLKEQFPDKWEDIKKIAQQGRDIYKSLLTRINKELQKYGYEPIPERKNYVTHTQEIQTFMDVLGNMTNLSSDKLPTAMASIHMVTKPGRTWFRFKLPRTGESTHEGLITALEKYIPPAGNQIFHTGDIQRGRAIEQYLRLQNEGTQFSNLSNFESYISQYVDSLAGKQNILDRPIEKVFGRRLLKVGDKLKKQTGANMVGGNISSALTNFIPFTQSLATTNKLSAVKGLYRAVLSPAEGLTNVEGFESSFLTRRFPEGQIQTKGVGNKASSAANTLFKIIDGFTSKAVVSGKYYEGRSQGKSSTEAIKIADEYASRLMADRSYGQIPLIFKSRTLGAFTQFQTEVNNQMSFLFKDIPKNMGYGKAQVVWALTQFVIYAYLFNELYEKVTGRRPQLDVLHAGLNAYQRVKNQEDWTGIVNPVDQDSPVGEIVQSLPFTSIFSGGRIPIGSAVPNPIKVLQGDSTVKKELTKLIYLLPPTGGGQIKKSAEGVQAYQQGASTTPTGRVRFPVEQGTGSLIQSLIFGQYSGKNAQDYFEKGRAPLGAKQSQIFNATGSDYYNTIIQQREAKAQMEKEALKTLRGSDIYKKADKETQKRLEEKVKARF